MSAVIIQLTGICSGGNHLTFTASGDLSRSMVIDLNDLSAPITEQDAAAFIRVVARLAKLGRTNAQARALLQTGATVTV